MTTKTLALRAVLITACAVHLSCDRKNDEEQVDEEVWAPCDNFCRLLQDTDSAHYGSCMDECVGADAEAAAIGPECVDVYHKVLACLVDFDNHEAHAWQVTRTLGTSGEGLEFACEEPSVAFLKACPGVWYNE